MLMLGALLHGDSIANVQVHPILKNFSHMAYRCWIKGPFPSNYSQASSYDNHILVATGIGITPALAAINAFKSSRRINLIWVVRDSGMLE
jgi:NAD(P)H-flavin reductase